MPLHSVGPSVIIIDDEDADRFFIKRILKKFGNSPIFEASSGEDAQDILRTHECDIAIIDLRINRPGMNRMDGVDLHNWIERHNIENNTTAHRNNFFDTCIKI